MTERERIIAKSIEEALHEQRCREYEEKRQEMSALCRLAKRAFLIPDWIDAETKVFVDCDATRRGEGTKFATVEDLRLLRRHVERLVGPGGWERVD